MKPHALALTLALGLCAADALASDKEDCAGAAEQAQRLRASKKLRESRQQLLTCGREVCPAVIRNDCLKWLRDVEDALPTVIFRVRDDADKDLIKVKITVDGQPFATELDGTAVAIDTGAHTFRYEVDGMQPYEESVLISQGEKDRVLKVQLARPGARTATTPETHAGTTAPETHVGTTTPADSTPPAATGHTNTAAWVFVGVGGVGLVTFGILEALGQAGYSDLKSGCGATAAKCADSEISPVQTKLQIALVGLGVGVVGLGVAAVLFATDHPTPATKAAAHLEVTPLPGGGFAGVHFSL